MSTPRTGRRNWILAVVVLGVGLAVWAIKAKDEMVIRPPTPEANTPPADDPGLTVRQLPDTRESRGEAVVAEGEDWDEPLSLQELLELEDPELIAGRVLDTNGKPVGGIWVHATLDDDGPPDEEFESMGVQTEENGFFVLGDLPKRVFRLTVSRAIPLERDWRKGRPTGDEEIDWIERIVVEGVAAGRTDVRIRVSPHVHVEEEWVARVRVLGPDGEDVPAWSYTECSNGRRWSSIEGRVEPKPGVPEEITLYGQPPYGLIVHNPATKEYEDLPYAPGFVYPIVPREEPYVVRLRRSGHIKGRVRIEGEEESANIVVRYAILTNGRAEDPALVDEQTAEAGAWRYDMTGTSADGSFEFEGLPPGRVRLIPLAPGDSLSDAPNSAGVTVPVGEENVVLRLAAHKPIQGTIDGGAVVGAEEISYQVHVLRTVAGQESFVWSKHLFMADIVRDGGRFKTPPLPVDEEFTVEVWAHGTLTERGEEHGRSLAGRRIERVVPGSASLFVVLARMPSIRGQLTYPDGRAGPGDVLVRALSVRAHPLVRAAWLSLDEELMDIDFTLLAGGVATPPEPRVLPPPRLGPFQAVTDAKGRFEFPALPAGRYMIWTSGAKGLARLIDPPVKAGADDVTLVLHPGLRITGRLRHGGSALPRGLVVEARDARAPGAVLGSSVVRSDGYFELPNLREGAYDLSVYNARQPGDRLCARVRRVPAGAKRVAIELVEGAVLQARVVDDQGGRVEGARVHASAKGEARRARVGKDGTFRIAGLHEDEHLVRVVLPDGRSAEAMVSWASEDVTIVVP